MSSHHPQQRRGFPLYLYEEVDATPQEDEGRPSGAKDHATLFPENSSDLFEAAATQPGKPRYATCDAITDEGLAHFQVAYPGEIISKEDVFYYVYGLLHSPDYRERYADNLGKELPRIPCVKSPEDFCAFSQAGRDLAGLHLNYETVAMYPATIDSGATPLVELLLRVVTVSVETMKIVKELPRLDV